MRRPNILLLIGDQQRWDTLRADGTPDIQTPHLDRLAVEGVNFAHCFVQNPVCTPSRASLLTGQYPGILGIAHMGVPVPPETVTLPRLVRNAGYTSANIGKLLPWLPIHPDGFGWIESQDTGPQACYDALVGMLAGSGVDLIKADDITGYPADISALADAIARRGRPIVLSLSPGGDTDRPELAAYRRANLLRTTRDIWDSRRGLDHAFTAWRAWQDVGGDGFWPDLDMSPFGHLVVWRAREGVPPGLGDADSAALSGRGYERMSRLTHDQQYTFITMRAPAASPLFMGGDLPTTADFSFALLTDAAGGIEIWRAPERGAGTGGWLGIFNRAPEQRTIALTGANLGLPLGVPPTTRHLARPRSRRTDTARVAPTRHRPRRRRLRPLRGRLTPGKEGTMPRPNILYNHSHDTGRYVQPYGHAIPTPHLQRLAEEGVLFRRPCSAAPTCSRSRAALLTGQAPYSSGMLGLAHRGFVLADYGQHLVHTLRGVGYTSTLIGIQHVARDPAVIGYDRVVDLPHNRAAAVTPAAVAFLRDAPAQPFFLSVASSRPIASPPVRGPTLLPPAPHPVGHPRDPRRHGGVQGQRPRPGHRDRRGPRRARCDRSGGEYAGDLHDRSWSRLSGHEMHPHGSRDRGHAHPARSEGLHGWAGLRRARLAD